MNAYAEKDGSQYSGYAELAKTNNSYGNSSFLGMLTNFKGG
jgi:hypothetical protein